MAAILVQFRPQVKAKTNAGRVISKTSKRLNNSIKHNINAARIHVRLAFSLKANWETSKKAFEISGWRPSPFAAALSRLPLKSAELEV